MSEDILENKKSVIFNDPLPNNGNASCPQRVLPPRTQHNYHLRFSVRRRIFANIFRQTPGEQPSIDLGHDDLLELFGHDEEWGLSELLLEIGTKIEIPIKDAQGVTFWIAGEVSSYRTGSLTFKAEFPGCELDVGFWSQTRNRADMEITWRLPPIYDFRERQSAVHMILNTQGYTPWHHPHHGSHWLRLQP